MMNKLTESFAAVAAKGVAVGLLLAIIGCSGGGSSGGAENASLNDRPRPGPSTTPSDSRNDGPFSFNNSAPSRYEQIDRMGVPVVASVLLRNAIVDGENQRDRFNESDPSTDADFALDIVPTVDRLHRQLDDDLCALNLTPCSRRDSSSGAVSSVCDEPSGDNFSITNCAVQAVPQIVPDILTYDLRQPDGFPNGRQLEDPVVDQFLAPAFLDLNESGNCRGEPCGPNSIADIPLNPPANELPFLEEFPFLALPHAEERE